MAWKMSSKLLIVLLLLTFDLNPRDQQPNYCCEAMLYLHSKSFSATMNRDNNRSLVFDRRAFTDPRVVYAICQSSGTNGKKCLVRRYDRSLGKEQKRYFSCEVIIEARKENASISDKVRVVPLGKDRVIVAYLVRSDVESFFGLINVRFRPCETHEAPEVYRIDRDVERRPYEFERFAIATNDTEYQVVYNNSQLCGDEYCNLRVDVSRGIASALYQGPTRWVQAERHRQVLDLVPFQQGYCRFLMLEFGYGEADFSLIDEDNDKRPLKHYKRQRGRNFFKSSWTLAYSMSNDRIGTCNILDSRLNCAQFDPQGHKIYEWEHAFNEYDDVWISAMHNLPASNDHDILALLIDHVPNRYKIMRLNRGGAQVGLLDVQLFDCDWRENAIAGLFFEPNGDASDTDYCVSLACYDTAEFSEGKMDRGHVNIVSQCFKLSDLVPIS